MTNDSAARENWVCQKCGSTVRYASGKCKACADTYAVAYRMANKEKIAADDAIRRGGNREKAAECSRVWREANKDKAKEFFKARYKANADALKQAAKERYQANPQRARELKAQQRAANPGVQAAADARYRLKHADALRVRYHAKRARRRGAPGSISKDLAKRLFTLQKGKCPCCKQPLGERYHMDHIIPLAAGGTNTDENIQLMRSRCNQQKSAKHPIEFMQSRGFLL